MKQAINPGFRSARQFDPSALSLGKSYWQGTAAGAGSRMADGLDDRYDRDCGDYARVVSVAPFRVAARFASFGDGVDGEGGLVKHARHVDHLLQETAHLDDDRGRVLLSFW